VIDIHRDDRLSSLLKGLGLRVNVGELRVPVRMGRPLFRLAVRLETVAQLMQQSGYRPRPHSMPLAPEFPRQLRRALARPAERRLGISPRQRCDQGFQIVQQGAILLRNPLPSASLLTDAPQRRILGRRSSGQSLQFPYPGVNRLPLQTGGARNQRDTAPAQRLRFGSGPQPPPLVHHGAQCIELALDQLTLLHTPIRSHLDRFDTLNLAGILRSSARVFSASRFEPFRISIASTTSRAGPP